jgi:PAS domain S-box-containing protein
MGESIKDEERLGAGFRSWVARQDRSAEVASVIENLVDGVVVAHPDGRIERWNRAVREVLGFDGAEADAPDTVSALPRFFELTTPEGVVLELRDWPVSRVLRGEAIGEVELHLRRLDKEWTRVVRYAGTLVRDASGAPAMAVVRITDVTSQRRLDEALRVAHAHAETLARLPEANPGPVLRLGRDQTLLYANPAARRALGALLPVLGGPTPEALAVPAARAARGGELVRTELTHEGQTIALSFKPVGDQIYAYGHDVTPRKKLEEGLRANEERLRLALDAADAGTWELDVATRTNTWSPRNWRLFGLDRSLEPSYETWLSAVLPEDREQAAREVAEALHDKRDLHHEFRVRGAGGSPRWLSSYAHPMFGAAGEVVRYVGIVFDITDRKRAEEAERALEREAALRASEAKFRALIDKASDIILVLDAEQRVQFWSPGATAALGWTEQERLGRPIDDLRHPDDLDPARLAAERLRAAPGSVGSATMRYRHKDGGWRTLDWSARNLLDDPFVRGFVVNARDVTERLRAEQELIRAQKLEALGVLAGGIAHDFNNLLTSIFGHLELVLAGVPEGSEAEQDLRVAAGSLEQGRRLTHQLLTFARGGAPVRRICHLDRLARDAVALSLGASSSVLGELEVLPGSLPVDVDEGQIAQVLGNLLINARQAMPSGGVVRVTVGPRIQAGREWVELSVVDSGEGIASEDLGRVFDPFFTTKANGTGLGLATAHSIVARHGGTLSLDSTRGEGTRATLLLPAATRAPEPRPSAEDASRALLPGCRVLLMDDEPTIRRAASALLRQEGCLVETSADGAEAVRLYAEARDAGLAFEVVVMDLTVPGGVGGAAAITQLLALDPGVIAIVSSGYSEDPIMADPARYGFAAALAKPYTSEALRRSLAGVLKPRSPR